MSELAPDQLEALKGRLEQMRHELTALLHATTDSAKPVDLGEPIGRLGRMDALQVQQMAKAQRHREEAQLQQVTAALARLRAGTYGHCLKCEEPIGLERLRVAPESSMCVPCRQGTERR